MRPLAICTALAWLAAATAFANTPRDTQFVDNALSLGDQAYRDAVIESGSQERSIGDYAQRVMSDFGTFNTQLLALAGKYHIPVTHHDVPINTGSSPSPQWVDGATRERLLATPRYSPARYLSDSIRHETRMVSLLQQERNEGNNSAFRGFATDMIRIIQGTSLSQSTLKKYGHNRPRRERSHTSIGRATLSSTPRQAPRRSHRHATCRYRRRRGTAAANYGVEAPPRNPRCRRRRDR